MAEVVCNAGFCTSSVDSCAAVVVTGSVLMSSVGAVDMRSSVVTGDDGFVMSVVVSVVVPDCSKDVSTLLLLLLTVPTLYDDVEVSVGTFVS